jgi:hypothetical protein
MFSKQEICPEGPRELHFIINGGVVVNIEGPYMKPKQKKKKKLEYYSVMLLHNATAWCKCTSPIKMHRSIASFQRH